MARGAFTQSNSTAILPGAVDSTTDASTPPDALIVVLGALARVSARHPFTETGAGALYAQRPVILIKACEYQSKAFFTVSPRQVGQVFPVFSSNRERSEFASSRPANTPNGLLKQAVGGFHGAFLMQLRKTSSLEAFEQ